MIALVRGVIDRSISDGSRLRVSGSTSTNTGRAPTCTTTFAVDANVIGVVITSSSRPTLAASSARWSAAVHELSATQCCAPTSPAKRFSNALVLGPVVIQPERRVSSPPVRQFHRARGAETAGRSAGSGYRPAGPACLFPGCSRCRHRQRTADPDATCRRGRPAQTLSGDRVTQRLGHRAGFTPAPTPPPGRRRSVAAALGRSRRTAA